MENICICTIATSAVKAHKNINEKYIEKKDAWYKTYWINCVHKKTSKEFFFQKTKSALTLHVNRHRCTHEKRTLVCQSIQLKFRFFYWKSMDAWITKYKSMHSTIRFFSAFHSAIAFMHGAASISVTFHIALLKKKITISQNKSKRWKAVK